MLRVENLIKTFGDLRAVDGVSFEVQPGSIMGMIGQNGSGKTTIFRMILNFLTPEEGGKVYWKNQISDETIYNAIGYLPEERGLYEKMTVEQQITYFAKLKGMEKEEINQKIDLWMDKFAVKGERKDLIKTLSKGNQQKVQLISVLIHEPELVILDEPFSGLDPVNANLLMEGILELKAKGSVIIFSSHNMNNVEDLCDNLVMIRDGKQVLYGPVNEVRESFGRTRVYLETPSWNQASLAALDGVVSARETSPNNYELELSDQSFGPAIFDQVTEGKYIQKFNQQPPTLEQIFKLKAGESHE